MKVWTVLFLLSAGAAWAFRNPKDYKGPTGSEQSETEVKPGNRWGISSYDTPIETKPRAFPWMAVSLAGLVFLIAAPFGLRAYYHFVKEMHPKPREERSEGEA